MSPVLVAVLALEPPVVDGVLDDAVWSTAPASETFIQKFPDSGAAPLAPTSVRVLHDREALYFGIDCRQDRTPITQRLSRRDRSVEADRVAIDIDTKGESAFHFEVNASGRSRWRRARSMHPPSLRGATRGSISRASSPSISPSLRTSDRSKPTK